VQDVSDVSWRQGSENETLIIIVTKNTAQFTVTDCDVIIMNSYIAVKLQQMFVPLSSMLI
jgi:hypothetical protein